MGQLPSASQQLCHSSTPTCLSHRDARERDLGRGGCPSVQAPWWPAPGVHITWERLGRPRAGGTGPSRVVEAGREGGWGGAARADPRVAEGV
jgi:hypothetical protein